MDESFSASSPSRRFTKDSFIKNKTVRIARIALLAVIIILVFLVLVKKMVDGRNQTASIKSSSTTENTQSKGGGSIAREFSFPLSKDDKNAKQFKFYLDKAEIQNEIVIKGQKATAVKGRDFLIVTIKITNDHDQAFKLNTRDYVRLSVNGNTQEWLAPDIHNDPVEVQAISTKLTRVGFPVNENVTDFALQVGEITGNKEVITLNLK